MRFLTLPDFKNIENMMKFPESHLLIPLCEIKKKIYTKLSHPGLPGAFIFTASLPVTQLTCLPE